jgi:hypothetical protein
VGLDAPRHHLFYGWNWRHEVQGGTSSDIFLAGSLTSLVLRPNVVSVGASAALLGLIGAYLAEVHAVAELHLLIACGRSS